MKKLIKICPKEKGSTIKFGKLPFFAKSLSVLADMDNVVQIILEGRYYAVEIRDKCSNKRIKQQFDHKQQFDQTQDALLTEVATKALEKGDFVKVERKEKKESKKSVLPSGQSLEEVGFTNLGSKRNSMNIVVPKKQKKIATRGDQTLYEWLNVDDFIVYSLFVKDNGNPRMDRTVDFDDICLTFLEAGVPDANKVGWSAGKRTAQRLSNVAIAVLTRKGVLQKDIDLANGKAVYRLSITKGGKYARAVYTTVSRGRYDVDPKTYRRRMVC